MLLNELLNERTAELNTALKQIYLLHTELSAHQSVLYQLGRAGEVTPAYGEDGRKILDAVPKELLERGRELVYPPKQPQEGD